MHVLIRLNPYADGGFTSLPALSVGSSSVVLLLQPDSSLDVAFEFEQGAFTMKHVALIAVAACTMAAGCASYSERVVEKPRPATTTQRTTVTEPVPGYPTATTTTTTTTPAR